jgi:hypothetical protein
VLQACAAKMQAYADPVLLYLLLLLLLVVIHSGL